MPDHYKLVFNGSAMVRRKIQVKRGKQVIVPDAKTEQKGSGIALPVVDKKEQQAKLRAELFKTF